MSENSLAQAKAQLENIKELLENVDRALDDDLDEAQEAIYQDPLEVAVRSGWVSPGTEKLEPEEYKILLCTGGPAVRIVGDLDGLGCPDSASLEHQDWFEPWISLPISQEDEHLLVDYARYFFP